MGGARKPKTPVKASSLQLPELDIPSQTGARSIISSTRLTRRQANNLCQAFEEPKAKESEKEADVQAVEVEKPVQRQATGRKVVVYGDIVPPTKRNRSKPTHPPPPPKQAIELTISRTAPLDLAQARSTPLTLLPTFDPPCDQSELPPLDPLPPGAPIIAHRIPGTTGSKVDALFLYELRQPIAPHIAALPAILQSVYAEERKNQVRWFVREEVAIVKWRIFFDYVFGLPTVPLVGKNGVPFYHTLAIPILTSEERSNILSFANDLVTRFSHNHFIAQFVPTPAQPQPPPKVSRQLRARQAKRDGSDWGVRRKTLTDEVFERWEAVWMEALRKRRNVVEMRGGRWMGQVNLGTGMGMAGIGGERRGQGGQQPRGVGGTSGVGGSRDASGSQKLQTPPLSMIQILPDGSLPSVFQKTISNPTTSTQSSTSAPVRPEKQTEEPVEETAEPEIDLLLFENVPEVVLAGEVEPVAEEAEEVGMIQIDEGDGTARLNDDEYGRDRVQGDEGQADLGDTPVMLPMPEPVHWPTPPDEQAAPIQAKKKRTSKVQRKPEEQNIITTVPLSLENRPIAPLTKPKRKPKVRVDASSPLLSNMPAYHLEGYQMLEGVGVTPLVPSPLGNGSFPLTIRPANSTSSFPGTDNGQQAANDTEAQYIAFQAQRSGPSFINPNQLGNGMNGLHMPGPSGDPGGGVGGLDQDMTDIHGFEWLDTSQFQDENGSFLQMQMQNDPAFMFGMNIRRTASPEKRSRTSSRAVSRVTTPITTSFPSNKRSYGEMIVNLGVSQDQEQMRPGVKRVRSNNSESVVVPVPWLEEEESGQAEGDGGGGGFDGAQVQGSICGRCLQSVNPVAPAICCNCYLLTSNASSQLRPTART